MIKREVMKETSLKEIEEWEAKGGIVHIISHHGAQNDHTKSTPLRVVVNSAMPNNGSGPCPNDIWPKGPNSLNNLFEVLTKFRSYEMGP